MEQYLLKGVRDDWTEVSREEWIRAERAAGFRPPMPSDDPRYMITCATGAFFGPFMSGKIEYS